MHEVSDTDVDETWEYDAAGNLVTIPGLGWARYEPGNRLVEVGGEKATYDDRDNLIELRRGIEWTRFSYDSLDNLVRVQWSDREQVWTAAYDGLGRRIWKQYGDARTEYYWDDDRLAAEIGPDGRVRVYAYTTSDAFAPFAFIDYDGLDAEPFDGRIYYVFTNQIGAPVRIEDGAGEPVWLAERYQAYGALELAPGARIECNLRWPGHFFDPETGLHYNRYRYYSPRLGRYIQTDPLGIAGGINTHAAPSNPVATVDLLGLQPPCKRKKDASTAKPHGKAKPDAESDADLPQRLPRDGTWKGEPGDSDFVPRDPLAVDLRPGQVVTFRKGEPDFGPFAWDEFDVPGLDGTRRDFERMDRAIAERYGLVGARGTPTASVGRDYRRRLFLVPHHAGGDRVQLVPGGIHGYKGVCTGIPHRGGASELRKEKGTKR